ncbi:lactate racemase domain-containing protein [Halocatena salina]|uniref:Nickel-dependent lactate racemase n=1 Tax=Halocatena salina TaxID=2934340 RepID=A0A8U0A6F6_9EURY|nr:lactate racemase domain-containing protein [Halocatena salina]UPM44456.1 nickel-dependent lactate racemase [Halocatena salina]
MEFPSAETFTGVLPDFELPTFVDAHYTPQTPILEDPATVAENAIHDLPLNRVPQGGTIAIGLGSRGIHDIVPIASRIIETLHEAGYTPIVVPAMGSHGGATAEGQRRTLAELGLSADRLGCRIDASMETTVIGETPNGEPVHFATAALSADGIVVVNRVKPHTNFTGRFESGLVKMSTVGLGKQAGAQTIHNRALVTGYVETLERAFSVVREQTPLLGGVAVVENFEDRTAAVESLRATALPDGETSLLEHAAEQMPTLPYDDLDVLVVEKIGKDISGAGMDTNVIGRYQVLNAEDPETPDIDRIVVLGLTESTHGNGQGIGLADITTRSVVEQLDFDQMYTNALTSSSLSKARLPVVLPDEEHAVRAALSTVGPYDPETIRIAWIRSTDQLSSFHVSPVLADESPADVQTGGTATLRFDNGNVRFV